MIGNWRVLAACSGTSLDLWFGPDGETPEARYARESEAAVICGGCTVRQDCGDYAVRRAEPWGVWGGIGEAERSRTVAELGIPHPVRWCAAEEHLLTGANVYVNPDGYPVCRACRNAADRLRLQARRDEARKQKEMAA